MRFGKLLFLPIVLLLVSCAMNKELANMFCEQKINKSNVGYLTFNESPISSMYPSINKTSIAFVELITEKTLLNKGDIISFKVPEEYGCWYVHRIVDVKEDNQGLYYITKGDNNWMRDMQKTRREDIEFKIIKII